MKKFYTCVFLIVSLFLLSSCKDRSVYFNYDEMIEKVVKIEVVETSQLAYPIDNKIYLLTLDDETVNDFLLDLSKVRFGKSGAFTWEGYPDGITFWIYYEDGFDYVNYRVSLYGKDFTKMSIDDYNYLVDKYYYEIIKD